MAFNRNNPTQVLALKSEIENDPVALGYATAVGQGNDNVVAAILNFVRDGVTAEPNTTVVGTAINVNKGFLTPDEIASAIVYSEYNSGGTANNIARQYIDMLMTLPQINVLEGSQPRTGLLAIFTGGTATRANLIAAAMRSGSRAEQLFGVNTTISANDVSFALRGV